jgi:hypothetical protein
MNSRNFRYGGVAVVQQAIACRLIHCGQCNRHSRERFPQRALRLIVRNQWLDRRFDAGERGVRDGDAFLQAFAHQGDLVVDVFREGSQARDVFVVVGGCRERHLLRHEREVGVEARVGVERHQVFVELERLAPFVELRLEHVVVDAIDGVQRAAIDARQFFQEAVGFLVARLPCREAHVGQLVVVAVVADPGGEERPVLEAPFPFTVEDRMERPGRRVGHSGHCAGGARRSR